MKEDVLFKKTPFGGFDRVEVITYIQHLKETQQKYKIMIDDKDNLNRKLAEDNVILSRQVESLKKLVEESSVRADQAEAQFKNIKSRFEMLEKKAEREEAEKNKKIANDTVKMCDELVETASTAAQEIVKQAEEKVLKVAEQIDDAKKLSQKEIKDLLTQLVEDLRNG